MTISIIYGILIGIVCLALGVLIGYIFRKTVGEKAIGSAEQKAKNMILDAENRSETIKKEITIEAKEEAHRLRSDVEREVRERRAEITKSERRLIQKKRPSTARSKIWKSGRTVLSEKNENWKKKKQSWTAFLPNRWRSWNGFPGTPWKKPSRFCYQM